MEEVKNEQQPTMEQPQQSQASPVETGDNKSKAGLIVAIIVVIVIIVAIWLLM